MEDNQKEKTIDHRFLARIVIEAAKPLAVHSGDKEVQTDAVVIRDVNGLPYIPGSSIAGVIRHAWKDAGKDVDELFGHQKMGSRLVFTEARILNSEGEVVDGLNPDEINSDPLLNEYVNLPIRQHVRITHRGVADDRGKFDEQIVYAGTRFCFEMEMIGEGKEGKETFWQLLSILYKSTFRLGSGSRKGFGKIKVEDILYTDLPLGDDEYLKKPANLKESEAWYEKNKKTIPDLDKESAELLRYELRPEDFFLFGSGFGDDDADMTPVREKRVVWQDGKGSLADSEYLVPASSVKGALAHRTAFHYNLLDNFYADGKTEEEIKKHTGANNEAVRLLFGCEGDANGEGKQRGRVMISDMYIQRAQDKILNHVSIDRFTGGAIDGALFSEKVAYYPNGDQATYPLTLEVLIDKSRIAPEDERFKKAKQAFLNALDDLCRGLLPLGGGVNRGHGIFNGKKCE